MTATKLARAKGEEMGKKALDRATARDPEWSDSVMRLLKRYALNRGYKPWTSESFLTWALDRGLNEPTDRRAIGPLIKKAVRDGLIVNAGFAPTVSSHGSVRATYVRA